MVKALADFGKGLFSYFETNKKKQIETIILQDRCNLKKASDLTEQTFWLMREFFASDSQFTMWVARLVYDKLNKDDKRIFLKFYKQKLKLKKKIEKLQKIFEKVD